MTMNLLGIRVRIRLLSPIVFLLMIAFSGVQTVLPPLAALSVHELGHIVMSILLKVKISEIELMPFGAAIRLNDMWLIAPGKLMLISLAGPLSNLLTCALMTLLLFFFPHIAPRCTPFLYSGLLIACVNLIPALPLDGGRFLSALLSTKMKKTKSIETGVFLGRILGIVLIASSVYAFVKTRTFPLPPLLASVYLFASGEAEKRHAQSAAMQAILKKSESAPPIRRAGIVMAKKDSPVLDAVSFARPGEDSLFAITDDEGEILTLLPLQRLMLALHENANAAVGNLIQKY